jgi:hypothetical protein
MPRPTASLESDVVNAAFLAGALAQPAVKAMAIVAPVPGIDLALSLVEKIFAVMEQMRYNKKQCRRLAESARDVVEAVEEAVAGITEEEADSTLLANVDKLVRYVCKYEVVVNSFMPCSILKRTADHLREIAALNFGEKALFISCHQLIAVQLSDCYSIARFKTSS